MKYMVEGKRGWGGGGGVVRIKIDWQTDSTGRLRGRQGQMKGA